MLMRMFAVSTLLFIYAYPAQDRTIYWNPKLRSSSRRNNSTPAVWKCTFRSPTAITCTANKSNSASTAARSGTPLFPPGTVHDDPNFGKVETYRKEVRVTLPFTRYQRSAA